MEEAIKVEVFFFKKSDGVEETQKAYKYGAKLFEYYMSIKTMELHPNPDSKTRVIS